MCLCRAIALATLLSAATSKWSYHWSSCANALLEQNASLFRYGTDTGGRSTLHFQCADIGPVGTIYEWRPLSLHFDVGRYLARCRELPGRREQVRDLAAQVDTERFRSGLTVCAPVGVCLNEFEGLRGMRRRDLHWWMRLENLTVAHAGHFLCAALIWSFLGKVLNAVRALLELPAPHPGECLAAFADPSAAWQEDTREKLREVSSATAPSLAICLHGGVRSFTQPEVYLSIRDNLVRSLAANYTRIFYVLNLTSDSCTWCEFNHVRRVPLAEVFPAMAAIGEDLIGAITLEPPCCWPQLRPGLEYEDCFPDNLAGPVQARGKELCAASIRQYEFSYDKEFDWILWTRPDMRWRFPLGDLRTFSVEHLHAPYSHHLELSDLFALIPRGFMNTYASAFRDWDAAGHKFVCLTRAQEAQARKGKVCDFVGIKGCWRCGYGSIGCLLEKYLMQLMVPLRRIPFEMVERSLRQELHTPG